MKELILTVSQHRKFGVVFTPFIIKPSGGSTFYSSIERANVVNVKEIDDYADYHAKLVQLMTDYSDSAIAKYFTKKKDTKTFIQNVDYDFVNTRIRPFIERRIFKIISILQANNNIRIFYQDRKYKHLYKAEQIKLTENKITNAVFYFNRTEQGIQYHLKVKNNKKEISLNDKKIMLLTQEPCSIVIDKTLYCFKDIDSKKLQPFFTNTHISIPKKTEKAYFEKFVLNTIRQFEVRATGFKIDEDKTPCKILLYLQNDLEGIPTLLKKYKYGEKIILPNNPEKILVSLEQKNNEYIFTKNIRNTQKEHEQTKQILRLGLKTKDYTHLYTKNKNDDVYDLLMWINKNADELKKMGVEIKQGFFDQTYILDTINIKISIKDENDWFDIRGEVEIGTFKIPFIKLRKNIVENIREYVLPDGSIAILPQEWFVKYKEVFLFANSNDKSLKLNKIHFNLLDNKKVGLHSKYAENMQKLFNTDSYQQVNVPNNINATIRSYQLKGFNWLCHLQQHGFGGCLADDMGLGKTIQTLTILIKEQNEAKNHLHIKSEQQLSMFDNNTEKKITPTSLIVMPASLIHNWKNEIQKFTPSLKIFINSGQNRLKQTQSLAEIDIVLSTYGVVRNDSDLLKQYNFNYIILDESQIIKNPNSKIYKAILELNAKHKLVLTGTPIENSLTDLWSQMNFINKGLLGSFNFFKNEFVTPIEKYNDEDKSKKLQTLIHPFVLRRTKEQVAKELPPKTEQTIWCNMSETQQKIYEKEHTLVRNTILENMEHNKQQKSTIVVLQALTKLRQIANHPALINKESDSGKFEEVTRKLLNAISENHKVLVFSSFVKHLKLYATYLQEQNINYSMLTGQTHKREEIINKFQTDDDNKVFLISLKAGGAGLNLTAADYVFLLDPWWNPASENQALSRAHRIGQNKKVFVYRFISSNSIEEKIRNLQNRKSELANMFINNNNPFKTLSVDNLKKLFE